MFFNNFDLLSPNISLYYNQKKRHLSPLGGLFTIIIFILTIYIIIKHTILKSFPNTSSLIVYRNFQIDESKNYFNESGLFHFIYIYNDENIINNNIMQINNLKKGIIRIYMTYSYDKYEFNDQNLKDNDHWVYDTCHNYINKNDLKYDYSFSSCIKYYYNSLHKKYYSIHDNVNFKWPYIRDNLNDKNNKAAFSTFIEKCSNNSLLNDIMGDCYPEDKINEYLSNFNNIFISFNNYKFEINNGENILKVYSYKIYDNLINNNNVFYSHELQFIPFNYEEQKNIISKKNKYNSFMFDGDRVTKVYNNGNSKLLLVYIFHFKEYINEFRNQEYYIFESLHQVGGTMVIIYFIFYFLNYFLNERIEIRNFQKFLHDKGGNMIHKHINYEKNKFYSIKSNIYTNISNEHNEQYNSFKSTYFGNVLKNDISNLYNSNFNNKINENNISINIEKIKKEEKTYSKKSDNIIVINNGTFNNDGNLSSNKKLNDNSNNVLSNNIINNKNKDFEKIEGYNKTYTYNKKEEDNHQKELQSINKNSNIVNFSFYSKRNKVDGESSDKNEKIEHDSKQKIVDTSSISLLNFINKTKNLYINNSNYNLLPKKEMPLLNFDKNSNSELCSPKIGNNKNNKSLHKENVSQKELNIFFNHHPENKKKISKKSNNFSPINYKKRRESHPLITLFRDKNESEISPPLKNKNKQTTGVFKNPKGKGRERHLSLFSRYSKISNALNNNIHHNKNKTFNLYPCENHSQNYLSKNLVEHYKKLDLLNKFMAKKAEKEKQLHDSESLSKNNKKEAKNTLKKDNTTKKNNNLSKIIQDVKWSRQILFNYLCLCKKNKKNEIIILNKFRRKLLSEEYLYILHFNMFIFKNKFGCKSGVEQINLIEELYNDY